MHDDTELLLLQSKNCIFDVKSMTLHPIISQVLSFFKNTYFHVLIWKNSYHKMSTNDSLLTTHDRRKFMMPQEVLKKKRKNISSHDLGAKYIKDVWKFREVSSGELHRERFRQVSRWRQHSLGRGQEKENGVGESRELTRTRRMRLDLALLSSPVSLKITMLVWRHRPIQINRSLLPVVSQFYT